MPHKAKVFAIPTGWALIFVKALLRGAFHGFNRVYIGEFDARYFTGADGDGTIPAQPDIACERGGIQRSDPIVSRSDACERATALEIGLGPGHKISRLCQFQRATNGLSLLVSTHLRPAPR